MPKGCKLYHIVKINLSKFLTILNNTCSPYYYSLTILKSLHFQYCQPTLICNDINPRVTGDKLVHDSQFLQVGLIHIPVVIIPIQQEWFTARKFAITRLS